MKFTKMQGIGNDFVVIEDFDGRLDFLPDAVRQICDRRFGVGADGIIHITRGVAAPWFVDFHNSDGTLAAMCGNGVRCVGKWLGDRGHADSTLDVDTRSGVKHLKLHHSTDGRVEAVVVDMGLPMFTDAVVETVQVGGQSFDLSCISMGNPHAVLFVDDVDAVALEVVGPAIQSHAERFPDSVNVEVASVRPDGSIRQRTFERGVGETLACGTGASAVVVAARRRGLVDGPVVEVLLRGGPLTLEWNEGGPVVVTGSATEVFEGEFDAVRFGVTTAD